MAESKDKAPESVAQVPAKPIEPGTLTLIGAPGSIFNINGDFGPVGVLTIGHQVVTPSRWDARGLRGFFPAEATGEVKIVNGSGEVWIGRV
jgi:hypothetical protein